MGRPKVSLRSKVVGKMTNEVASGSDFLLTPPSTLYFTFCWNRRNVIITKVKRRIFVGGLFIQAFSVLFPYPQIVDS
jgi:hypothetical protein